MGFWEKIHNLDFNVTEFRNIKNQSGSNGFVLTVKQWVQKTNAIGIISKPGRYGGIVFKDITAGEISHTTLLDSGAVTDYRSVVGYFTQVIMKDLRLVSGYDVLYGKVKF